MRTKVPDHSNVAKAKKVQQASTQVGNRFTTLILMDVDLKKIGRKTSALRGKKTKANPMTQKGTISKVEALNPTEAGVGADIKASLCTACSMRRMLTIGQGIVLPSLNPNRRSCKSLPLTSSTVKEVNHTSHWHQPSQSSSSNQPSYQNYNHHLEYQPNYHRYPSQYY
jgi:hypothetical protein